ncbi:MAG: hypothetical protein IPH20_23315 [Bacteroidales bacterium]|nr:hypothetical protein [Bacteroidales bacterium]
MLLSTNLFADNIITSGTTLRVTNGTTLVSTSAITIQNGATLNNLGTVLLSGNLTNQNVAAYNLGAGTISMSGTALQIITGQNVFVTLPSTMLRGEPERQYHRERGIYLHQRQAQPVNA